MASSFKCVNTSCIRRDFICRNILNRSFHGYVANETNTLICKNSYLLREKTEMLATKYRKISYVTVPLNMTKSSVSMGILSSHNLSLKPLANGKNSNNKVEISSKKDNPGITPIKNLQESLDCMQCNDFIVLNHSLSYSPSTYSETLANDLCLEQPNYLLANSSKISSINSENNTVKISKSESNRNDNSSNKSLKPNEDQLRKIQYNLSENLPNLFASSQDFRIYHKDILFQNNIKGITTKGIGAYVSYIAKIKIIGHLLNAYIKMDLLKATIHPEDGTVRIRWRIKMISGVKVLIKFWKYRFWNIQELVEKEGKSIDGFSIFYVNSDGLITKHTCDKMMPDENIELVKPDKFGVKLAVLLGGLLSPSSLSLLNISQDIDN